MSRHHWFFFPLVKENNCNVSETPCCPINVSPYSILSEHLYAMSNFLSSLISLDFDLSAPYQARYEPQVTSVLACVHTFNMFIYLFQSHF